MTTSTSLRIAIPLLLVPGAFLLIPGCGGGDGGPTTPTPTSQTPTATTPTTTPTTPTSTNITRGQTAFAQAVNGYDANGNTAAVRASIGTAVSAFQAAVNSSPNSSDANTGLAASLLAQVITDPSSPLVKISGGTLLTSSNALGLDNVVSMKGQKSGLEAPLSVIKKAFPKFKSKGRTTQATIDGIAIGTIQNYISTTELPRMKRIAAALAKTSKATTYGFVVYKSGTESKKLYGPDLHVAETFVKAGIAVLGTVNGYNLDPGNLYNNVSSLSNLDTNKDRKLTVAEYTGTTSFLKLRSDGATNLTLALASLRETATLGDGAIRAEASFNAPADALIRLTSAQKQELRSYLPYVTQVKTALAGQSSYPINDDTLTVNVPEFYVTPLSDLRQGLPVVSYNASEDEITGFSLASTPSKTFGGLFPDGTAGALNLLLED